MTESKERPDLIGELMETMVTLMESMVTAGLAEKQPDGGYRGVVPDFTTELTPEGEQYVIPGAERRTTREKPQGELFKTRGETTMFTITSWDRTKPETFGDYQSAYAAAISRAASEGAVVHLRDDSIGERANVYKDGTIGKWHDDSPRTEKDSISDAIDEIDDAR